MFCAHGLVFSSTEGIGSRILFLCSRARLRRYRRRRVSILCFALPNSFSAVPRVSVPIFMFCAPGLVFGSTVGVGSRFHILHSRTRFRRYRGRWVVFLCSARSDSFSAVLRASGPVIMFFAPGHVFGGAECVGSHFYVFRARAHFRRYRGRRLPFSCFMLPDSFPAIQRASIAVFLFCAPGLIFGDIEGIGSRFHVLLS
jgi:hypothetical protein